MYDACQPRSCSSCGLSLSPLPNNIAHSYKSEGVSVCPLAGWLMTCSRVTLVRWLTKHAELSPNYYEFNQGNHLKYYRVINNTVRLYKKRLLGIWIRIVLYTLVINTQNVIDVNMYLFL